MSQDNLGGPRTPTHFERLASQAFRLEQQENKLKLMRAKIKIQMAEELLQNPDHETEPAAVGWNEAIKHLEEGYALAIAVHTGTANDAGPLDSEVQEVRAQMRRICTEHQLQVTETGTGFGKFGDNKVEIGPKR